MKAYKEPDGRWIISLARGDSVRESLEGFAKEHGIVGAKIDGIGAVEDPEIGSYDLPTKAYHRRTFSGIWELLSMHGNLTTYPDAPFLHAHVTISGHDFKTLGGHLFDARIGVAGEIFVEPLTKPLRRIPCEAIGLPRWEPGE